MDSMKNFTVKILLLKRQSEKHFQELVQSSSLLCFKTFNYNLFLMAKLFGQEKSV